jgi:hypothetical protein
MFLKVAANQNLVNGMDVEQSEASALFLRSQERHDSALPADAGDLKVW